MKIVEGRIDFSLIFFVEMKFFSKNFGLPGCFENFKLYDLVQKNIFPYAIKVVNLARFDKIGKLETVSARAATANSRE